MLNVNPADAVPIWKQIEDELRRLIAVGRLEKGNSVPSVRDLARDLRVNPATVSKAYQRLTDQGLLEVRRGEGTFVAGSSAPLRKPERREALASSALRYASQALTIGASPEEALRELEAAFQKIETSSGRKS